MTALTPGTEGTKHSTGQSDGLLRRAWNALLAFLRTSVRMWVVMVAVAIGVVLIWAVATNVKDIDRRQRDGDRHDALAAAYAADVRAYDNAFRDRQDCLADVERSLLNRGQHEANVVAYETLKPFTPPAYQAGIQIIIDALRAGPLLSSPPRSADECPPAPVAPTPPDG